jgi:hypothetical protein
MTKIGGVIGAVLAITLVFYVGDSVTSPDPRPLLRLG